MSLTQWFTRSCPTVSCRPASIATLSFVPTPSALDDEHGLGHVGRHAEHAAESAELAARAGGERRQHVRLDAVLRLVGRVDVDAGGAIVERRRSRDVLLERDEPVELARRARGCPPA